MSNEEVEQWFRDSGLVFMKQKCSNKSHWKIPKEDHVIRFIPGGRGSHVLPMITIRNYRVDGVTAFSIDLGIAEIQKIIQRQFERVFIQLYGIEDEKVIWSQATNTWIHRSELEVLNKHYNPNNHVHKTKVNSYRPRVYNPGTSGRRKVI